jgi:YD repeat-containing protein
MDRVGDVSRCATLGEPYPTLTRRASPCRTGAGREPAHGTSAFRIAASPVFVAISAWLTFAGSPSSAQHVERTFYDAHGRVVATVQAAGNGGSRTRYVLDGASNRSERTRDAASSRAVQDQLRPGEGLLAGQHLRSADGRFAFVLQETDGNAVIYGPSGATWASSTSDGRSTVMSMQHDGNLVIYGPANEAVWASGTSGHPGAFLAMQNDGNLVIYDGWTALWASGTGGNY